MLTIRHKRLWYILALLFVVVNVVLVSVEFYYLLALPAVLLLGWFLVRKPVYVFYFLAFATPLSIQLSELGSLSLSIPTEPLIILLFLALIVRQIQRGSISLELFRNILALLILGDLAWLVITSITSTMPLISAKYLMSKVWYLAVFYFLASHLFTKEKVIRIFMWSFIIAVSILSAYTLYQHAQGGFSRSYAYTAMRPFLPDHGMYAACISFAVPMVFVLGFYGDKLKYSVVVRVIALVLFVYLVFAVRLSFTRASWLSLVVAFGVLGALLLRIRFHYLLIVVVAGTSVVSYHFEDIITEMSRNKSESDDNINEHLNSVTNVSSDPSNMERLNRWSCAYRMFEEKPLVGFGPGTYTFQYGVYQLPHEMTIISSNTGSLGNVHSEYLRPLAEGGLIGFLLFMSLVLCVFYMGFYQFNHLEGSARYLSLAAFLALITYFTHGLLNNYSEFDKIAVPLYSMLAVLTSMHFKLRSSEPKTTEIQEK